MRTPGLILAVLLAGCGGSDTFVPEPQPPTAARDAFFQQVSSTAAALPEDAEAVGIESIAATTSDDAEPIPL